MRQHLTTCGTQVCCPCACSLSFSFPSVWTGEKGTLLGKGSQGQWKALCTSSSHYFFFNKSKLYAERFVMYSCTCLQLSKNFVINHAFQDFKNIVVNGQPCSQMIPLIKLLHRASGRQGGVRNGAQVSWNALPSGLTVSGGRDMTCIPPSLGN